MRFVRALSFGLLVLLATPMPALELVRVWPGYRAADTFFGIGEYFGRSEPAHRRPVLRTRPEDRAGYYWLLRLKNPAQPTAAIIVIDVIRSGETEHESYRLPLDVRAGSQAVLAGLTGIDWSEPEERPLAWRVTVLDAASGETRASEQSFLWSLPPAG